MNEEQAIKEFEEWYDKWLFKNSYPLDDKKLFMREAWLAAWRKYGREDKG